VSAASHDGARTAKRETPDPPQRVSRSSLAGFLLGSAGMFATMYSTQAILPELGRDFGVSPSTAGLTISVVVLAIAAGAWVWGPLSDRWGRKRSLVLASWLLVLPTIGAGLAPSFGVLLGFRALQGFVMPGLLTVGVPYVIEAFTPAIGGLAMGYYVAALVCGGLLGRVGVALVAAAVGWRWGIGGLAALPLAGALLMQRTLPEVEQAPRTRGSVLAQLRNAELLRVSAVGASLFFTFVGVFSYVVYRLEEPPFRFGTAVGGLIFLLWVLGVVGPLVGRLADGVGWRRLALAALAFAAAGLLVSLPTTLPTILLGLGLITIAMFGGVTAAQLGVADASATDRGVASALYYSAYYLAGGIGGYVPGLAWQAFGWDGVVLLALAALTVSPVRFLYPNLTPRPWKLPVMLGATAWLALLLAMLVVYRRVPGWVVAVSLIYPAFYATLSILIDPQRS
jgi:YNFM family putative membrane transporter